MFPTGSEAKAKVLRLAGAVLFALASLNAWSAPFDRDTVKIGVLSNDGIQATLKNWVPTANYLNNQVREHNFEIVPIEFDGLEKAVSEGSIHFLLANSSVAKTFETRFGITHLATLKRRANAPDAISSAVFGGTIYTKAGNDSINSLLDIRNKRFGAVHRDSLGGWQAALFEFVSLGIKPERDFKELRFFDSHSAVVLAVLNGIVDAGTSRTGTIEEMAALGVIKSSQLKVIRSEAIVGSMDAFPDLLSTRLYPEWPISKLAKTPERIAAQVQSALIAMPENSMAAKAGGYAGWTYALNYNPIQRMQMALDIGYYSDIRNASVANFIRRNSHYLAGAALLVALLTSLLLWIIFSHQKSLRIEKRLSLILNGAGEGIWGLDRQGRITFTNPAACTMLGLSSEQMIGRDSHSSFHYCKPDRSPYPATECPIRLTLLEGQVRINAFEYFIRTDGTILPVKYSSAPITENGQITGAVVVFADITDIQNKEKEAKALQEELTMSARLSSIGTLAAGLAHEINNPLTIIKGNISLLKDYATSTDPKVHSNACSAAVPVFEKIEKAVSRITSIIKTIQIFSGPSPEQNEKLDVHALINETQALFESLFRSKNITFVTALKARSSVIKAQYNAVQQILISLLNNAFDALDNESPASPPQVSITTSDIQPNLIQIEISDNGHGIRPEDMPRIFDPFFTTKSPGQGTGMGLSIVYSLVRALGGNIRVEPNANGGTKVLVQLPKSPESLSF